MFHDGSEFRQFLKSPKFIWLQFAWVLWANIRHVAILRIPWCFMVSVVKLILYRKWESPIVCTSKGRHLAIIGKRELKDYTIRQKAVEHPELKEGNDCVEVERDTYLMGIYGMSFICDSRCNEKVKQACLYGTKDKKSWYYRGDDYCGLVEGFYELTNEIISGVYIVDEISQVEFLRRIVEMKGRYQLESTDWWVTGYHKPHEIIFRSRWSILKSDSRLYSALPIIPIFLNSQFSKESASLFFMFLIFIDLLLPLTIMILNLMRYMAKTRLQILVSRIRSCRIRKLIFDILTGFRPGMKPTLDKFNKVFRRKEIYIIAFPKEDPVCYPFPCFKCTPLRNGLKTDTVKLTLDDGSIIHYSRLKSPGSSFEEVLSCASLKTTVVLHDGTGTYEGPPSHSTGTYDGQTAHLYLHLTGDAKASSKQEEQVVEIKIEKELDVETKPSMREDEPVWPLCDESIDFVDCTLWVENHEGTRVWDGTNLKYTRNQRAVLEFFLENMRSTFSVEACSSRLWGKEICVQPKNLFDTLDDITSRPQLLLMEASGNFLVGPSIPNRSRLFRL